MKNVAYFQFEQFFVKFCDKDGLTLKRLNFNRKFKLLTDKF